MRKDANAIRVAPVVGIGLFARGLQSLVDPAPDSIKKRTKKRRPPIGEAVCSLDRRFRRVRTPDAGLLACRRRGSGGTAGRQFRRSQLFQPGAVDLRRPSPVGSRRVTVGDVQRRLRSADVELGQIFANRRDPSRCGFGGRCTHDINLATRHRGFAGDPCECILARRLQCVVGFTEVVRADRIVKNPSVCFIVSKGVMTAIASTSLKGSGQALFRSYPIPIFARTRSSRPKPR